jgi:hypothetical protein
MPFPHDSPAALSYNMKLPNTSKGPKLRAGQPEAKEMVSGKAVGEPWMAEIRQCHGNAIMPRTARDSSDAPVTEQRGKYRR